MHRFYISQRDGNRFIMDSDESHHCLKVLRMSEGDRIEFTDGQGFFYTGVLLETKGKAAIVEIISEGTPAYIPPYSLHLAIAPTKNAERFEWFVEKAIEIGVDEITPILCRHSERRNIRTDRLEKIAIAAMKQSLKARLTQIHPLTPFKDFIKQTAHKESGFIAWCGESNPPHLLKVPFKGNRAVVCIGPEGDFDIQEIEEALMKGYLAVGLGKSRLRTETAGVVAAQIMSDRFAE